MVSSSPSLPHVLAHSALKDDLGAVDLRESLGLEYLYLNSGPIHRSVTVIQNIFRAHTIVPIVAIIAMALVVNGLSGVHLENENAASS